MQELFPAFGTDSARLWQKCAELVKAEGFDNKLAYMKVMLVYLGLDRLERTGPPASLRVADFASEDRLPGRFAAAVELKVSIADHLDELEQRLRGPLSTGFPAGSVVAKKRNPCRARIFFRRPVTPHRTNPPEGRISSAGRVESDDGHRRYATAETQVLRIGEIMVAACPASFLSNTVSPPRRERVALCTLPPWRTRSCKDMSSRPKPPRSEAARRK